jgi:hypothetical protein
MGHIDVAPERYDNGSPRFDSTPSLGSEQYHSIIITDCVIVGAPRARRGETVQDGRFGLLVGVLFFVLFAAWTASML